MRYVFFFKLILWLSAIMVIFGIGCLVGFTWAAGMTDEGMLRQLQHCLPATTADELRPCLSESAQGY